MYVYTYICVYIYIYIFIYMEREREREMPLLYMPIALYGYSGMYICLCIHTCVYIYIYREREIYIHTYIHTYIHVYSSLSLSIYIYISRERERCIHISEYHVYMSACLLWTCLCVYTHTCPCVQHICVRRPYTTRFMTHTQYHIQLMLFMGVL